MANPPKGWKVEYAKTSRSSCKVCKKIIEKEKLRVGKMIRATQFDGFMPRWNHPHCILKTPNRIKFLDDIEGVDMLRWEDQQKIRNYIENGVVFFNTATVAVNECSIEASKTSRAKCKLCNKKILEGEVRISTRPNGPDDKVLAWHHAKCYMQASPSTQLEKLSGWDNFSVSDQGAVHALIAVGGVCTRERALKAESLEDEELLQKPIKGGSKRKLCVTSDQKSKSRKTQGNVSVEKARNENNASDLGNQNQSCSDFESKTEDQNKALWAIKNDLKNHVSLAEMREMLEANGQHSAGSEFDLRDRCADGMMFGALGNCPLCSGSLRYSGVEYRCHGYLSAWSKCSYSTTDPIRLKDKWRIPKETINKYLLKWFKTQKGQRAVRILPSLFSNNASGSQAGLKNLKVTIVGVTKEEWRNKIEGAGGTIYAQIMRDTKCLVVSGLLDMRNIEIRKARIKKLPILRVDYLVDCIERQKMLPFDQYKIKAFDDAMLNVVTVKVKGKSSVHESSGLQYTGHILEHGKRIYNTTLNMSDLSVGVNSYYVLQVIQEDKRPDCYLFREWGRVGNSQIGGNKLEKMSKSAAIKEFENLFLKKTGNPWEAWEQKETFQKHAGKFYPLDIDYGVNKQIVKKKKDTHNTKSRLAPGVVKLIKMLFNIETYRSAMMEFEIDMSEMPLGKLSKSNIQKGFEALTEIQNLLNNNNQNPSVRESLLVDASNRFFTVIPSIHPHVIRDENGFSSKVKMLEALQDIEIASRLVGFDDDNDESFDEKYMKLHCDISLLPHDSEDYRLVEKYLHTTHASTHKDWKLELEDVFTLEREGELDKYAPYRDKLQNKMLLWHGSRLTNFVGILSEGLRIAPPEAPSTGYMFGKGIYFADLVSKSAQYCYTDTRNPVGLMVLSEVALGDVYELKQASYMEKPPEGKHSTKGLGKKIPRKSEYVTWKNETVVPCGKPVASNVRSSELMYNEYIVYDTAQVSVFFNMHPEVESLVRSERGKQVFPIWTVLSDLFPQVKMQFLLKVRFHHKNVRN